MKLLFIAYELDPKSQVLAWQYRLVHELAAECSLVLAAAPKVGAVPARSNVVFREIPSWLRWFPVRLTFGYFYQNVLMWSWCRRHHIDVCLVHMHHKAAYRYGPAWRLLGIPVVMWYAHGSTPFSLRVAHACVDRVVCSTPEGFRLKSHKVEFIGQCIDTELFAPQSRDDVRHEVITVSRVSRRKHLDLVIEAFALLSQAMPETPLRLRVVGAPITNDDQVYAKELRLLAERLGVEQGVIWDGHRSQREIAALHARAFVHLNVSQTGSMDKTAMEALACDCPVLTSNEALISALAGIEQACITDERPEAIARKICYWYEHQQEQPLGRFRSLVTGKHDLGSYVGRLIGVFQAVSRRSRGA